MSVRRLLTMLSVVTSVTMACGGGYGGAKQAHPEAPAVQTTGDGAFPTAMREDSYGGEGDDVAGVPADSASTRDTEPGFGGFAKQAPAEPAPQKKPPVGSPTPSGGQGGPTGQQGAGAESKRAPILIYTADFTMSVFEVAKSIDAVEGLAKAAGGYLARRDDRSITIRVPAEKFADVILGVEKVGDVTNRNVVSEDVTAEYRDLEVQLQNLLALRLRFEKLLEKANKVEEALQIEKELGRVTGEIERIKGRLKLLTDLSAFSTITVTFAPRVSQTVQEGPFVLPLPWLGNLGLRRLMAL